MRLKPLLSILGEQLRGIGFGCVFVFGSDDPGHPSRIFLSPL